MLATMVAVAVVCAPAYCLGETGWFGVPNKAGQASAAHGCCASADVPVDSQPADRPGPDEGCGTCLFSAGMLDHKVSGGTAALPTPTADDLPLWLIASPDTGTVSLHGEAPVLKAPADGLRDVAGARARQARLCVFLI